MPLSRREQDRVARVVEEHRATIRNYARLAARRYGDDADEIEGDVLLRICRHLGQVKCDDALTSWLYKVTIRVASNRFRRRMVAGRPVGVEQLSRHEAETEAAIVQRIDTQRKVTRILGAMPIRERRIVVRRRLVEMTLAETAVSVGLGRSRVGQIEARAFEAVRSAEREKVDGSG